MPDLKVPVTFDDHVRGDWTAGITLVEYGDYQCPYCAEAERTVRLLQQRFGGRLRFVFRNFPLTQLHPEAEPAAEAAEFAGAHSETLFWQAHEALYENQPLLGMPLYAEISGALGLSAVELRQAIDEGSGSEKIRADFEGGAASGVNGTPAFFINGRLHQGASDFDSLATAIEAI